MRAQPSRLGKEEWGTGWEQIAWEWKSGGEECGLVGIYELPPAVQLGAPGGRQRLLRPTDLGRKTGGARDFFCTLQFLKITVALGSEPRGPSRLPGMESWALRKLRLRFPNSPRIWGCREIGVCVVDASEQAERAEARSS